MHPHSLTKTMHLFNKTIDSFIFTLRSVVAPGPVRRHAEVPTLWPHTPSLRAARAARRKASRRRLIFPPMPPIPRRHGLRVTPKASAGAARTHLCAGIECAVAGGLLSGVLLVMPGESSVDLLQVSVNASYQDFAYGATVFVCFASLYETGSKMS